MQKNIKKSLIIIPIMLALCLSFIGVKSYVIKYCLDNMETLNLGKKFINGNWYFFNAAGKIQTGIYVNNNIRYYSTKEGIMISNEWITNNNKKYYVKADSSLAVGNIIINGKMERFDDSGEYKGSAEMTENLFIKFLNVGSADCAYLKLPNGETALIDTGDVYTSSKLVSFLKEQDLKSKNGKLLIDYVIITHPHSDHIGGLTAVLDNFKVKKIYMLKLQEIEDWYCGIDLTKEDSDIMNLLKLDYDVYKDAIDYINKNELEITNSVQGEFIDENSILQFIQCDKNFELQPIKGEFLTDYWNNKSTIIYLNYGMLQVLFTGDIQFQAENDFVSNKLLNGLEVDILKVPHHGYNTSSSIDFLKYVKPEIGVISTSAECLNIDASKDESVHEASAYNNLLSTSVSIYETSENDEISIYATEENWNLEN